MFTMQRWTFDARAQLRSSVRAYRDRLRTLALERVRTPYKAVRGPRMNRICHPEAWEDPSWMLYNRLLGMPQGEDRFHRKAFEWTQCVYGLETLGALGSEASVLGVGAGHECVLYYFANRSKITVALDLYRGAFAEGGAQEASPELLRSPERFAPFAYRREVLRAVPGDGTLLPFPTGSFDVVYSLSSIEHFGGHGGAARAMVEIGRVLRPGGVACIATEWILEGGEHPEYFTCSQFEEHVVKPSGLVPVEALDVTPPPRRFIDEPVWVLENVNVTPHLVLGIDQLRWTSVVVFLRKPRRVELWRPACAAIASHAVNSSSGAVARVRLRR